MFLNLLYLIEDAQDLGCRMHKFHYATARRIDPQHVDDDQDRHRDGDVTHQVEGLAARQCVDHLVDNLFEAQLHAVDVPVERLG